jgi:hypothetical protein
MCVKRRTHQPITQNMIDIMMYLNNHASSVGDFGCDLMILGLFTGYCIGEYSQTDNCAHDSCTRGACGDGSGEFSGTPLVACHPDFIFFNFCSNKVPYTNKLNYIGFVEIYFCWKKSRRHGQFRTFKAVSNDPPCQVSRARHILLWDDTLCIHPWKPVAVFRIPATRDATNVKRITSNGSLKRS